MKKLQQEVIDKFGLKYNIDGSILEIESYDKPVNIPSIFFKNYIPLSNQYNFTRIYIYGKIKNIGINAFRNCKNINYMEVNSDTECSIAGGAFSYNPNLERIVLGEGVISLGPESISNCDHLIDIKLPNSLVIIGHRAFADDKLLTNIDIPHNVEYCPVSAFEGTHVRESYIETVQKLIEHRSNAYTRDFK